MLGYLKARLVLALLRLLFVCFSGFERLVTCFCLLIMFFAGVGIITGMTLEKLANCIGQMAGELSEQLHEWKVDFADWLARKG